MAAIIQVNRRPSPDADYRARSAYRAAGIAIGFVGLAAATVALAANIVAGNLLDDPGSTATARKALTWSFGVATGAFATVKFAIAVVLVGIIARLWMRVDGVKAALSRLKPPTPVGAPAVLGDVRSDYGPATAGLTTPPLLFVHRMAKAMWAPMLAMGAMLVVAGLVLSFVQTGNVIDAPGLAREQGAWVQGLQFLGEGFMLSGISFLLGTILASLRAGGGEVQESLGVVVKTLKMPWTAKVFLGLMALGLMVSMAQFGLYVAAAQVTDATSFAAWSAWLGPLREVGLGLLLSGIVFALATIGTVLGFQFGRVREILRTGS